MNHRRTLCSLVGIEETIYGRVLSINTQDERLSVENNRGKTIGQLRW